MGGLVTIPPPDEGHLQEIEALLARILRQTDPVAALARVVTEKPLPRPVIAALGALAPDGLRITALLVARLRFERILRTSAQAEAWFDTDTAGFTAAFARYHAAVAPGAIDGEPEGARFERWCAATES